MTETGSRKSGMRMTGGDSGAAAGANDGYNLPDASQMSKTKSRIGGDAGFSLPDASQKSKTFYSE